ncbi:MAG TPA: GGDEF domain-containing protein [Streptosporangiaceae bacterium]|nr:GGDEF domain-containing protein [Streptosporangiaceae bacterium]
MPDGCCKRVRGWLATVRAWPIWELPRGLVAFIAAVILIYSAGVVVAMPGLVTVSGHDVLLLGALLLCIAATVELTKRAGENAGLIRDVYAVWELPLAILLPPVFAMLVPVFRLSLVQLRIRQTPLYRRVFSAAMVGLSYGAASLTFHALTGTGLDAGSSPFPHPSIWMLAVAVAAVTQWVSNTAMLLPAVKGADPAVRIRELLLASENVHNDVAELCVAVLVTLGIAVSPLTIVFALPFVTLLQRSVRHAQLLAASRIDSKTGLLNAGTWEREAASEVARAVRTRTPLALVLIDVDHFKLVNDVHGHLAGDTALRAIARTFKIFLRDYDLAGRFGGEEFALLLPQTSAADARQIAERMRGHIEAMPIGVSADPGAEPVQVTVSIGVAALGVTWENTTGSQLTDLLAGADSALYQAKNAGRNQVWMVTDTATVAGSVRPGQLARLAPPPVEDNYPLSTWPVRSLG